MNISLELHEHNMHLNMCIMTIQVRSCVFGIGSLCIQYMTDFIFFFFLQRFSMDESS